MEIALADGMFIRMAGPSSGRTLLFVHAFADCGLLPNAAAVSANLDTDAGNDEASASILVLCPDLHVQKLADDASVSVHVASVGP